MKQRIERNIDKLGKVIVIMFMIFLFFVNIGTKILKFIRGIYRFILRYGLNIIISFYIIISLLMIWLSEPKVNKPFLPEDKAKIENFIDGKGKDIIIILDFFEEKNSNNEEIYSKYTHGAKVVERFIDYYKNELKKEKYDILPIFLSFDVNSGSHKDIKIKALLKNKNYKDFIKKSYPLEEYIKIIREKNPNSKIVLSLSISKFGLNDKIIELSKKYDLKLAQAYVNYHDFDQILNLIHFYYFIDKTNTLIVYNGRVKPLLYNVKKINPNNIDMNLNNHIENLKNKDIEFFNSISEERKENYIKNEFILNNRFSKYYSTSFLTPILAYEYYLNPNSNLIKK